MSEWYRLPDEQLLPVILEMWCRDDHWVTRTYLGITAHWLEPISGGYKIKNQDVDSIEEGKALIDSKTQR